MRPAPSAWWLMGAALLAFLPTFFGVFQFDDYNVIVDYPTVHSWQALWERWGGGVRPLLKASYTFSWTLGLAELGFHLLNLAIHALNTVLIFHVSLFMAGKWYPRSRVDELHLPVFLAALLFALHPVQVEAVTYISGRSASLMATFYLAALLVYLRGGHWIFSVLLFVLALAVKETAVTLPAALLLCELARRERAAWREIWRRQAAHWLVLAAGAVFVLASGRYLDHVLFGFTRRALADNLLTQVGGVSYLLARLAGIQPSNIDPALPTLTGWDAALVLQAALFALLILFALTQLRRRPWLGLGLLWFFLHLAPTNSLVPRLDVANDRQLYLAAWGLFLALAVQLSRLSLPPRFAAGAAAALLALCAAASILRQLDYRSEIALWEHDTAAAPWNPRAYNNLGYAYQRAGRLDEARLAYRTALAFDPGHSKARFNLLFLKDAEAGVRANALTPAH